MVRSQVIPTLLASLEDENPEIRDSAALALGKCGDAREVSALVQALSDRDRNVSAAATLGLGLISDPVAEVALAKLLAHPRSNAWERGFAALALGLSGGHTARDPLFDDLGARKVAVVETCRVLGAALWAGADKKNGRTDRAQLVAGLVQRALASPEARDRALLCMGTAALSKTRDPASTQFVLAALQDPRFDLRAAAAIAAGRVFRPGDGKGVKALTNALLVEGHLLPRRFMLIALGRIGGPEAIQQLAKEFESKEAQHRAFAALALGIAGAVDQAPRLRQEMAGGMDERLKGALVISLGLMKDPHSSPLIIQMIQGNPSNTELVSHCMWSFALNPSREALPIIQRVLETSRVADVQEFAATALGTMCAVEAQPRLIKLLVDDGPATLRVAAATGLGRMGDHRGVAPLVKLASNRNESAAVRAAAVAALGVVAQRADQPSFARIAVDYYYGLRNDPIDEICARVGGIGRTTEQGGRGHQGGR